VRDSVAEQSLVLRVAYRTFVIIIIRVADPIPYYI
jgi:hypothetical protein